MKKYRVIQGIILLVALHTVLGTSYVAAQPIEGVVKIAELKPTVIKVGDTKINKTSGNTVIMEKPGQESITYTTSRSIDGNITYNPTDTSQAVITCNQNTGVCNDSTFQSAIGRGLLDAPGAGSDGSVDGTSGFSSAPGSGGDRSVIVSAKVPGANCKCYVGGKEGGETCPSNTPVEQLKYKCEIGEGLSGFQSMFASIIRYVVYIVTILSVLAIVGLGIAWSLAGGDDAKAKSELKKWGINILIGMIILFFFRYILQFIAPWIYN